MKKTCTRYGIPGEAHPDDQPCQDEQDDGGDDDGGGDEDFDDEDDGEDDGDEEEEEEGGSGCAQLVTYTSVTNLRYSI